MNQNQGLPVGAAVDFGWSTFKEHAPFILGIEIAILFVTTLIEVIAEIAEGRSGIHGIVMWLVYVMVTTVMEVGALNITLKYYDRLRPEFADLFDRLAVVPFYLLSSIVMTVAAFIGFMLLFVPGIIVMLRFQFYGYSILERNTNPIDAIQDSFDITRGYTLDLFLFGLLLFAINLLGAICLLVGLFVSIPVTILATTYIYRYLRHCSEPAEQMEPPATTGAGPIA